MNAAEPENKWPPPLKKSSLHNGHVAHHKVVISYYDVVAKYTDSYMSTVPWNGDSRTTTDPSWKFVPKFRIIRICTEVVCTDIVRHMNDAWSLAQASWSGCDLRPVQNVWRSGVTWHLYVFWWLHPCHEWRHSQHDSSPSLCTTQQSDVYRLYAAMTPTAAVKGGVTPATSCMRR